MNNAKQEENAYSSSSHAVSGCWRGALHVPVVRVWELYGTPRNCVGPTV